MARDRLDVEVLDPFVTAGRPFEVRIRGAEAGDHTLTLTVDDEPREFRTGFGSAREEQEVWVDRPHTDVAIEDWGDATRGDDLEVEVRAPDGSRAKASAKVT